MGHWDSLFLFTMLVSCFILPQAFIGYVVRAKAYIFLKTKCGGVDQCQWLESLGKLKLDVMSRIGRMVSLIQKLRITLGCK